VKPVNILVTAASRRVPLVQGFKSALRALDVPGSVIVTDVNPLSPAVYFADRAYRVPMATEPNYIAEVMAICAAEHVCLAVPTIDDEVPLFGAARDAFQAMGVLAACSSETTAATCNDKFETCRVLREHGVAAAESFLPDQLPADLTFPLFIKPRVGRGAVGAFPVRSQRELDFFREYVNEPVLQEFLSGPEFTIDVLCDFNGRPLSIVPRERVVIRAGVIDRGRTVRSEALIALAEAACRVIPFAGPINIQCRMRGDMPVIFEINPRFSGGIPLTISAGADFPQFLVKLAIGMPVEPAVGDFREDMWMTSYESSVFLDPAQIKMPSLAEMKGSPEGLAGSPKGLPYSVSQKEVA
jgi:carbamoyl-phosphate synthase large subunit